jgi:hypothetical protein
MQGWKTFAGLALAAAGELAKQLGFDVAAVDALQTELVGAVDNLLVWGGLAFATYGRVVAKVSVLKPRELV